MNKTFLTALLVLLLALPAMAAEGLISVPSHYNVEETAARVENLLNDKGMTIFDQINHSEGARKVGIDLRDTRLLIFGNPKVGSPLMQCQQSVAIDLPQKILIWQDAQARVWISYNDPGYLKKRHNIAGCDDVIAKIAGALSGISTAAAAK